MMSPLDTLCIQAFDRSSVPLIKRGGHQQPLLRKSSFKQSRGVKYSQFDSKEYYNTEHEVNEYYDVSPLSITGSNNCNITSDAFQNQKQRKVLTHPLQNKIIQKVEEPFMFGNETFEFEDFSQQSGQDLIHQYAAAHMMKRNHDIVPLSFERVNRRVTEKNQLHQRKTRVSKANKFKIKCVLVGDPATGKTNLVLSYLQNKFVDRHIPTASDIYNFEVKVNKRPVQVTLYDTAGQDSLDRLRQLSYPDCDVFLLCFSVVSPESFTSIKLKWAPTFYYTKASLVLVGTQSDLRSNSQTIANLKKRGLFPVSISDAWDLAHSIGAEYVETSSRNNCGVKNAFDAAIETVYSIQMKDSINSSFWKKLFCLS